MFFTELQRTLDLCCWEQHQKPLSTELSTAISALPLRQSSQVPQNAVDEAFKDLSTLSRSMNSLCSLSASLYQRTSQKSSGLSNAEEKQLRELTVRLAISTPVLAKFAKAYDLEIASEFSLFISRYFSVTGHKILLLGDAFCLYNRARGFEFVSTTQLHRVCTGILPTLADVKFSYRALLHSGAAVLIHASSSEQSIMDQIMDSLPPDSYTTSYLLSSALDLSDVLARDFLASLELEGRLCRDESVAGIHLYRNKFL